MLLLSVELIENKNRFAGLKSNLYMEVVGDY
jgi:hypothetical protein